MTEQISLSLSEVEKITHDALSACGATGSQLTIATQSIVDAECDGIRTVGLNYLPIYCNHLQSKKLNGSAQPTHEQLSDAALRSDAVNGFAHTAFVEAENDFYTLANQQGIAALSIVNSYSAGVVGWFVQRMAERGLIGLGFANSPSAVAPTSSANAFFGTNPLAFSVPRKSAPPLVADMATSQVALVTIKDHAANNKPIPLGWGYDASGNPTEDAAAVINGGALAPVGGYKGMLLGLLVDVLAGALAGPNCSFNAPMFKNNEGSYPAVGQFFLAIAPGRFLPTDDNTFGHRLEAMLAALTNEQDVRLPGDRRHAFKEKAQREGVSVPKPLHDKLMAFANHAPTV